MAMLILAADQGQADASIGGKPLSPRGTPWPTCKTCSAPMQFLAQLPLTALGLDGLSRPQRLLIFQCQADPGMCEDWDAEAGGNAALLVDAASPVAMTPPEGDTLLPVRDAIRFAAYDDSAQEETPDDNYCDALDDDRQQVLGKVGGTPLWLQNDETPSCACGTEMMFVAQLEAWGGGGINFGDAGIGYAFACPKCAASARFLWQCS